MLCRDETFAPVGGVLQRTLAGFLSATILLLTVLAVSPGAHVRLHADAADADHACAITLFAHGIISSVGPIDLPAQVECPETVVYAAPVELSLVSPRYLLQPLRGPPVS